MNFEGFITHTQAAGMVGVCVETLKQWSDSGNFPKRRYFGVKVFYIAQEVKDWMLSWERTEKFKFPLGPRLGASHHRTKFPSEFIAEIHRLRAEGLGYKAIATRLQMGLTNTYVRQIIKGRVRKAG